MSIEVAVLGSGSKGNATVLRCGQATYLIDAGLSAKQIVLRLEALGVCADQLAGIFITHEHSDHARGLDVLLKTRSVPVYANAMTREAIAYKMKSKIHWRLLQTGHETEVDELKVLPFAVPHDAAEPVGYVIERNEVKFGLVTDVGYATKAMKAHLSGLHGLFVEANYDDVLLEEDQKRPWATKQRIASKHGHLSNVQAGELIAEVGGEKLQGVFLGHLSSDCNTSEMCCQTVSQLLKQHGLHDVRLECASQDEATPWMRIERRLSSEETLHKLCAEPLIQGNLLLG